jgi:hypothetical protein
LGVFVFFDDDFFIGKGLHMKGLLKRKLPEPVLFGEGELLFLLALGLFLDRAALDDRSV